MSPEAQRIAIAEACRWKRTASVSGMVEAWCNNESYRTRLPDYLFDLNAMHEAWEYYANKDPEFRDRFHAELCAVVTKSGNGNVCRLAEIDIANATAAERAEAFLRAIGKWDDTK